jgi:ABC-type transport system substrate-binding protein
MKHQFKVIGLLVLALLVLSLPLTAQDELLKFEAPDCEYGGLMKSIEAVDATTVKFTLCAPDPAFPSKAAFSSFQIYPSEYLESTGGTGELITAPVGTGPYKLESWTQGSEIVLTRNDSYWGEAALEPTVVIRWNAEAAARFTELQAGTADGIDNVGTGDIDAVRADPNLQLIERAPLNVFYIGFNNTIAPFDNLNVRQAIAHAIDTQRIVDNFYPAGSQAATQFMPPAISSGYTPEVEPFPFDQAQAAELLKTSGLELPVTIELRYRDVVRGYLPNVAQVAEDIRSQLEAVMVDGVQGFVVTVEVVESGTFIDNTDAGAYGMYLLGWGADYPDATNFLDYHFGGGSSAQFGERIQGVVDGLAAAGQLSDLEARNAIYAEVNALLRDEAPMLPVAHGASAVAYRAAIGGFPHASPLGNESFAVMEDPDDDVFVWVQNGEPAGLYCADESDGEALRVCEQIGEPLLGYEVGGTDVVPALAVSYEANEDATEYTFTLRDGVLFHDGSALDANDVVLSWGIQWDASHPLHVGRDGSFTYFSGFFGSFLNAPATE